jgi:prolipoprotein diacylglyceryl transferase
MALLAQLTWDLDPEIFSIGNFALRWYGVCFAAGFLIGFSIMKWIFQEEGKPEKDLDALCVALVVGTIVGARLGHCLLYEPGYYLDNPLEILKVWKGGLASHGGSLGVIIALWFYSRKRREQPYGWVIDRVAVPTALAAALIRLGNFFNSEIVGTPSDVPWAIVFPRAVVDNPMLARHPAQLYECLGYLLTFGLMLWLYRSRKAATPHGLLTGWFLICVFTTRIVVEFFKVRQATFAEEWPISWGQVLSVPFVLAGVYLVWRARRNGSPQVTAG